MVADDQGMLEPYAPKGSEEIESAFKDDKKVPSWVGIDAWMTGITVNTKELKAKNISAPSSYEDLIKPEYKDLISMPSPASSGTGYLTVSELIQIMGEEKAWQYMDKLHKKYWCIHSVWFSASYISSFRRISHWYIFWNIEV